MTNYINFNLCFKLPENLNLSREEKKELLSKMENICLQQDFTLEDSEFDTFEVTRS